MLYGTVPIAAYHLRYAHTPCTYTHKGRNIGVDQMQAISQAVEAALSLTLTISHTHTYIWLRPLNVTHTLLTLKPHRDMHIMYNVHAHMSTLLTQDPTHLISIQGFQQAWLGTPS